MTDEQEAAVTVQAIREMLLVVLLLPVLLLAPLAFAFAHIVMTIGWWGIAPYRAYLAAQADKEVKP